MDSVNSKIAKLENLILITLFFIMISLPLMDTLFGLDSSAELGDTRPELREPLLELTWHSINTFPDCYDKYINGNFGFRNLLVRCNAWCHYFGLGVSSSPKVMLGKEGWLFMSAVMDYHRGLNLFTPAELEAWKTAFEYRHQWLADRGIRYLFVVAPNKHSIYPEYLPEAINPVGHSRRLDQLNAYLEEHAQIKILDLREVILQAKEDAQVYEITGTHWNYIGSYSAYQAIIARISDWFPRVKPTPYDLFRHVQYEDKGNDLADLLGLEGHLREMDYLISNMKNGWQPIDSQRLGNVSMDFNDVKFGSRNVDMTLPRAVMFRDSFSSTLIPFLSSSFRAVIYYWQDDFDVDQVPLNRTDLVIHEIAERKLQYITPEKLFAYPGVSGGSMDIDDSGDHKRSGTPVLGE